MQKRKFNMSLGEIYLSIQRKFNMSLGEIYLSILGIFILGFFIIFISPSFTGRTYSYNEASLNDYQTLSNNIQIALVKKEYNPENEIMRLDFSLKETSSNSSLSNIKYEISSEYITNRKMLDVESIRVNDNYIIAIVKDIPKDFSVLSTTIVPKYIHPEIEKSDTLKDRSVKIYVNESEKIINPNLKIEDEKYYEKEYITFEQQEIRAEIKDNEKEVQRQYLIISELNKAIDKLQNDSNYQTEEELARTITQINSHKSSINKHQKQIESLMLENLELEEKIQLLDKKSSSI